MRLLLHIGTEKTGSTAFQDWLLRNAEALKGQGVWRSAALGAPSHRAVALLGRRGKRRDELFAHFGVDSEAAHAAFVARTADSLAADVAAARAAGARVYVISSEHGHSRLIRKGMVARLAGYLQPHFDEIGVVCLLRPQLELAVSRLSTIARAGGVVGPGSLDAAVPGSPYFDYPSLLERWGAVFGRDRVTAVPLRRAGSAVAYFQDHLGVDAAGLEMPERINSALDYRVVALANRLFAGQTTEISRALPRLNPFLDDLPCEEPLTVSRSTAEAVQGRFQDQIAALTAASPALQPQDFEPDWSAYPVQGTLDRLDQADIGAPLQIWLAQLHALAALGRAVARIARAELADRDGDRVRMLARLAEAEAYLAQAEATAQFPERVADRRAEIERLKAPRRRWFGRG